MFVRWQRRRRSRRGKDFTVRRETWGGKDIACRTYESVPLDEWTRCAGLLNSVRTPAGPRQEYVCYLGAVPEGGEGDILDRRRFWRAAERGLRNAGVSGADLAEVVAALEAVVPRPDGWAPPWDEHWEWP
jgi:hypothetical protein